MMAFAPTTAPEPYQASLPANRHGKAEAALLSLVSYGRKRRRVTYRYWIDLRRAHARETTRNLQGGLPSSHFFRPTSSCGLAFRCPRPQAQPGVRQRRIASTENGPRRSVSIATPKAARGAECSDKTGQKGTRERGSDSDASILHDSGPLSRAPPARSSAVFARGIEAGWPRRKAARFTRARCGGRRTRANERSRQSQI